MSETLTIDELTAESHAGTGNDLFLKLTAFEGPIDLLLMLAREQKVDLAQISVLALAEQYLAFVNEARKLRLEIAADYLVMAAWLAYLKSRLLLPAPPKAEEPSAVELAEALAFQLKRLEAMQKASSWLQELPQEGRGFVFRGMREPDIKHILPVYYLGLYDLLKAVKAPLQRNNQGEYRIAPTKLFSMDEARERMRKMLGFMPQWSELSLFMPEEWEDMTMNEGATSEVVLRSALASTFAASLELAKQGQIELRQDGNFGPIYLRPKAATEIQESETHD
ncbi:MAG: segregation/condensation protein A [Alphaproteobacteria bacterium]|nr:segregation/condensation protein A [Alphaproteobacteria bacterium]